MPCRTPEVTVDNDDVLLSKTTLWYWSAKKLLIQAQEVIKNFMLNSAEHGIFPAHKY